MLSVIEHSSYENSVPLNPLRIPLSLSATRVGPAGDLTVNLTALPNLRSRTLLVCPYVSYESMVSNYVTRNVRIIKYKIYLLRRILTP